MVDSGVPVEGIGSEEEVETAVIRAVPPGNFDNRGTCDNAIEVRYASRCSRGLKVEPHAEPPA